MNKQPILSICIPTYNNIEYLKELVENLLSSNNAFFELIISDNCSTDGTPEMLDKYNDTRLIVLKNKKNIGSDANGKKATSAARGDYVLTLTDKDIVSAKNLDKVINFLSNNSNIVAGKFEPSLNSNIDVKIYETLEDVIVKYSAQHYHPSGLFYKRLIFNKIKPFDTLNLYCNKITGLDSDFIVMLLCQSGAFAHIYVDFIEYRVPPFKGSKHSSTYSPENNNLYFSPECRFEVFELFIVFLKVLKFNIFERLRIIKSLVCIYKYFSTKFFLDVLDKKNICDWYNLSEKYIEYSHSRNLKKEFCLRMKSSKVFTTKLEYLYANIVAMYLNDVTEFSGSSLLKKIFSVSNLYLEDGRKKYKVICILGLKIKFKIKENVEITKENMEISMPFYCSVGKHTYGFNKNNVLFHSESQKERLIIGDFCSFAPNVAFILASEHSYKGLSTYPFKVKILGEDFEAQSKGDIVIKDDVWIGLNSIILSGVTINQGAIVAAGSVVTKDVPPYAIVGGNPAKVIKYRFEPEIIEKLVKFDYSKLTEEKIKILGEKLYTEITKDNIDELLKEF